MPSNHERLLDDAKKAADNLHGDTSVDPAETLSSLKDLRGHVEILIEAVDADDGDDDG